MTTDIHSGEIKKIQIIANIAMIPASSLPLDRIDS
jgi:hypothetical protein